ncbi:MAG: hypothetical protein J6P72_04945 [Firmicutes bacterium]|nr:hypothetical protein [Bacillota bacterium]
MSLEQLWTKLEKEEPLTGREETEFTEEINHGIDELETLNDGSLEQR